jgi:arylsulfatase A-like enzyme
MIKSRFLAAAILALALAFSGVPHAQLLVRPAAAQPAATKPNILMIMGDDIEWFNLGAYNGGMMRNATPNLDALATQGMRLTDYYADSSCMASSRRPARSSYAGRCRSST